MEKAGKLFDGALAGSCLRRASVEKRRAFISEGHSFGRDAHLWEGFDIKWDSLKRSIH